MAYHARGQDFLNELSDIHQDIPISPQMLNALFSMTSDQSDSSLVDIAKVIEKDQGLTVRILAMANSAYYGLQSQVGSVHRAVMILGLHEVRKLLLLLNIRSLEQRLDADLFDISTHWRHQVDVAHAARIMTGHTPGVDPEELFTIGLLHDLGKVITALYRSDDWKAILELRAAMRVPLFMAEDAYWGLDHALIGSMTLKSWFLPASLTEPINWHHAPELARDFGVPARMIRLADVLVHHHDHHDRDEVETNLPAKDIHDLNLPEDLERNLIPEMRASGQTDLFLRGLGIPA